MINNIYIMIIILLHLKAWGVEKGSGGVDYDVMFRGRNL